MAATRAQGDERSAAPGAMRAAPGAESIGRAVSRIAAAADRVDERRWARRPPLAGTIPRSGALAGTWATAKLAFTALTAPIGALWVGGVAARNTAALKRTIDQYPREVEAVLHRQPTSVAAGRVHRLDAASRLFITSDLHRCVRGSADWPGAQNTKGIYEVALEHYGAGEWELIENGDVEDFWLVGGSAYGVVYDIVRTLAPFLPRVWREALRTHLGGEHLQRIVENNRAIYDRIDDLFHRHGRYHRLVGNHDDCYLDERMVDHLRQLHEGVDIYDFLVVEREGSPVAVITHGHHTDSWNAPHRAGLGRYSTWLASAVVDAPFLSANPGAPAPVETDRLLTGTHADVLTVVNALGLNRELYTVDEVLLHRAFAAHFGDRGPLVLLGHTHLPLARPKDPGGDGRQWSSYMNSGSGVHWEMVTGLEWDGTRDPDRPEVRLVGWHYADADTPDDAIVGEHDGRPVARCWFEPSDDGTLDVFPTR